MSAEHSHGDLRGYIEGLREDLGRAEERIRELEALRPTCGICNDATATRMAIPGLMAGTRTQEIPVCTDCAGDPA